MRKTNLTLFVLLACLFALAVHAADVTGTWVGQMPGRQGNTQEVTLKLKSEGDTLTGSMVTPRGEMKIDNGKVDGDNISFTQTMEFNGNTMKLMYKGKVSGTEIKLTREREGGQGRAQEFTVKKQS